MATLVDTNVLLRLLQPEHPQYPIASMALAALRRQESDLCVARQNLVEFWAVATRPLAENGLGMSPLATAGEVRVLHDLFRVLEGKSGIAEALGETRFGPPGLRQAGARCSLGGGNEYTRSAAHPDVQRR